MSERGCVEVAEGERSSARAAGVAKMMKNVPTRIFGDCGVVAWVLGPCVGV